MKLAGRKTRQDFFDKYKLSEFGQCTPTIKEEHLFVPKVFAEIDLKQPTGPKTTPVLD